MGMGIGITLLVFGVSRIRRAQHSLKSWDQKATGEPYFIESEGD